MKSPLMFAVAALAHVSRLAAQSAVDDRPAEDSGIHLTIVQLVDHAGDAPPADGPHIDPARWIFDDHNPLTPEHAFCPRKPIAPDDEAGAPLRADVPPAQPDVVPEAGWIVQSVPPQGLEALAAPVPEPSGPLLCLAAWAAGCIGYRRRV